MAVCGRGPMRSEAPRGALPSSGSDFDLYSVVLHETGHSLGLEHPDNPDAVMNRNYGGLRAGPDALGGAARRAAELGQRVRPVQRRAAWDRPFARPGASRQPRRGDEPELWRFAGGAR